MPDQVRHDGVGDALLRFFGSRGLAAPVREQECAPTETAPQGGGIPATICRAPSRV